MSYSSYIFIGPQKTGSSFLYSSLRSIHVNVSRTKETFYFDRPFRANVDSYKKLFFDSVSSTYDISPSYFSSKVALERISLLLPDAKIIIGIRDPYELSISYLRHLVSIGKLSSVDLERGRFNSNILDPIDYSKYITMWLKKFPSLSYVLFDKLTLSRNDFLSQVKCFDLSCPPETMQLLDLRPVNSAHIYKFGFGSLRQVTPYLNYLPFSDFSLI